MLYPPAIKNNALTIPLCYRNIVIRTCSFELFFWVSVTQFDKKVQQDKLISELEGKFTIIKDELNVPLRNTLAIVGAAHNKGKRPGPRSPRYSYKNIPY